MQNDFTLISGNDLTFYWEKSDQFVERSDHGKKLLDTL